MKMITATFKKKDGVVTDYTIEGHAMFDRIGKDIVCASVSGLAIAISNAVEIDYDQLVKEIPNLPLEVIHQIPDRIIVKCLKDNERNKILTDVLIRGITDISEQFPDNVKVVTSDKSRLPYGTKLLDKVETKKLLDG